MHYDNLAKAFAALPLQVHGIYETELAEGLYRGHLERPTSYCGLLIPLSGQAVFTFDERDRYELKPGITLLGGLGMRLELAVGAEGFRYFLAHYLPEASAAVNVAPVTEVSMLEPSQDPQWRELMKRLQELDDSPGPIEQLEKKAVFYQLLGKVLRSERARHNREGGSVVEDAIHYIRTSYMEPVTLESLAERCGMKPKYFSFLFQKYAGISPIHYLIRYRMSRARELLMTGRYTVSEVAKSVGYSDAYYFSRLFKKHTGHAPSKAGLFGLRNNPSAFGK